MTSSCTSVNIIPPFGEFTAPLCHILPIHKVTINSNNLFVNFRWTFTFCVEKSYDGTHLAFGGTFDWRCHFKTYLTQTKPVLPLSNEHGSQVKDQGQRCVAIISIKNFSIGLHVMYLYFPDTPRIFPFSKALRRLWGSIQPRSQRVPGGFRQGREADY